MNKALVQILVFISICCWLSCDPNVKVSTIATNQDSTPKDSKAFNRELIINIAEDTIVGYAFVASGEQVKETIILVAGYPGNDNNFDIAQAIRRSGKNVVHFNHRGAWGSQGVYSYSSCLEDIEYIISYLSIDSIADDLRIDLNRFTLLGRSYGGGISLIQGSQINSVQRIIAISSVNYGELMHKYDKLEELASFRKYMEKQIMINSDIDKFLQELLDNKKVFNVLSYKRDLADKDLLFIEDSKKNQDWIEQIENAKLVILESDHNFIDKRIELTDTIVSWLNQKD